jgi:hypothetical protein
MAWWAILNNCRKGLRKKNNVEAWGYCVQRYSSKSALIECTATSLQAVVNDVGTQMRTFCWFNLTSTQLHLISIQSKKNEIQSDFLSCI